MSSVRYDDYVKSPHMEHDYTPEEIKELIRCSTDCLYFCRKYVKIVTTDEGIISFNPYEYQIDLINKFHDHRFSINLLSRQSGKTTIVAAYALWYACFFDNKNIGIVSNKADSAQSFLARLKEMYEALPTFLKPGVTRWAEKSVKFDNKTKIQSAATSKDSFRGEPMSLLLCDEFAFVDPQWKANEFWASNYPTVSASKTAKIIIISTPNGMNNMFHTIWLNATKKKNSFIPTKYDWRHVPGRDDAWAEEQKGNLGLVKFNQEFGCDFIGSSHTVLDPDTIERLMKDDYPDNFTLEVGDKFRVYEKPQPGKVYILGCDVAKGTGEHYSTIQVLRVDSIKPIKLKQVAVFEDNMMDTYKFSQLVNRTCYYFNNAHIMVENNGIGNTVVSQLWWEYENENLINSGSKNKDLGVGATKTTKPKAVLLMKKLIEDYSLDIQDYNTVIQLSDFIDKNGKFKCENMDDDLVSGLYWASYFLEMDILDEKFEFNDEEQTEEAWGFLSDVEDHQDNDFSWLTQV